LENEGAIEVRYEKNHAHYRLKATTEQLSGQALQWFEKLPAIPA
jgi:hypothetical protein